MPKKYYWEVTKDCWRNVWPLLTGFFSMVIAGIVAALLLGKLTLLFAGLVLGVIVGRLAMRLKHGKWSVET